MHGKDRGRRGRGALRLNVATLTAAVLVSGGGSNLQAFIDAVRDGRLELQLCAVLSDNPHAKGLERARLARIPAECLPREEYADAPAFDRALDERLTRYRPDLLILAGFMRILTGPFVARYAGRILNIHPSLLPKFRGLNTHQRAIDAGERWHGCTVHFVTERLDGGPRIAQSRVPVLPDDTAERLAQRVLAVEHRIYPWAAGLVASGRVRYADGCAWYDGEPLEQPLNFEL